jgi:polysaccharide biosynthesis/export protein
MTALLVRLGALAAALVLSGCGGGSWARSEPSVYADAARNDPRRKPYVIGVSDLVRVTVWKDPGLSTDAVVRPDGTITLPLVGELRAAGRTAAELQKDAETRFKTVVNEAVVTVSVVEINSYRFTVAGNVQHPGLFNSRYYLTVSEAIALAGGPNRYADTDDVVIVRTLPNGSVDRIRINYDGILAGTNPEHDIAILPGDAVRVP